MKPRKIGKKESNLIKDLFGYDPISGVVKRIKILPRSRKSNFGCVCKVGYLYFAVRGTMYPAHRLGWFLHYGVWPKMVLDHINGNKLDNRICNLIHREGHLVGTSLEKNDKKRKWVATAPQSFNGKYIKKAIRLGRFLTQREAHEAVVKYFEALPAPPENK